MPWEDETVEVEVEQVNIEPSNNVSRRLMVNIVNTPNVLMQIAQLHVVLNVDGSVVVQIFWKGLGRPFLIFNARLI
jgi:hypothetical protein